jgi:hypothetical protein
VQICLGRDLEKDELCEGASGGDDASLDCTTDEAVDDALGLREAVSPDAEQLWTDRSEQASQIGRTTTAERKVFTAKRKEKMLKMDLHEGKK